MPIKPFTLPPVESPTLEITEFSGNSEREIHPYAVFMNHLYVYPISLNFETQKIFSRARNIALTIELRNSDMADAKPIEVINALYNLKFIINKYTSHFSAFMDVQSKKRYLFLN